MNARNSVGAMAFYHSKGLVPAFKQATRFAGEGGRIGTLPDIIAARMATELGSTPWESWMTTLSAEYVGFTRGGTKVIIVAHGIGPMATLDGAMEAYSFQYKDKSRNRCGGRITQDEFWKLESGHYGPVYVVDFNELLERHRYPFIGSLHLGEALVEPLLHARFGPQCNDYLMRHAGFAREWLKREHDIEEGFQFVTPFLLTMGDASNCPYGHRPIEDGMAFAHLLSTGALANVHHAPHQLGRNCTSLMNDVHCHNWSDGVRFIGIRDGVEATDIHPGFSDLTATIWHHRERLMLPNPGGESPRGRFFRLMTVAKDVWFTMYSNKGHSQGTGEAEFRVTSLEPVGDPVLFRTEIHGYHGIFRYDVRNVMRLAPADANAFDWVDEPRIEPGTGTNHHIATVQFYRADVDTSQRLMRQERLENNFELMMELAETNT